MSVADPLTVFQEWYDKAHQAGIDKPHGMTLATVDADGTPSARVVLLSSFDELGFVFHSNYESAKGKELAHFPRAALVFWWDPLGYQVRIEGHVKRTSAQESDAYFAGRPRGSQLGAWASDQSRPIESRAVLDERMKKLERQYDGKTVPRPPHWGGYRVIPRAFEFWQHRDDRLHDRIRHECGENGEWRAVRLAP